MIGPLGGGHRRFLAGFLGFRPDRAVAARATARRLPDQLRAPGIVVVLIAQAHRMRRLLHSRQQRGQQHVLGVDQPLPVVVGQLVLVRHRQ
jgi:hypothetical protein